METWLQETALSMFIRGHSWVWPTCETLHFIGLILLIGNVGLLDLRMLGALKDLPARPLNRFVMWGALGFAINLATGIVFFVGMPEQYTMNLPFYLKMLCIMLAGVNLAVFYATGVFRKVDRLAAGDDAPGLAKAIAAVSLCLWVAVMYFGRMLPYLGNAF